MKYSETKDKIERDIRSREFTTKWFIVPIMCICLFMTIYKMSWLWFFLTAVNGLSLVLHWSAIRASYRLLHDMKVVHMLHRKKKRK